MLHLVIAQRDVIVDIALVASHVDRLLEFGLSFLKLLLLVEDTALSDQTLWGLLGHLGDQAIGVGHLLQLVLDVALDLQDSVVILGVVDLRSDLACLGVHACL